jgi:IPT/TIG domain
VETLPTSGKVGESVTIIGTNLTGATTVTFNQTAASFTVRSGTLIRATVPVGATTGTVQVVTPSGTLASNTAFTVTP